MELIEFQLVIGSDMNAILDHMWDKSNAVNHDSQSSNALRHLLSEFNRIDTWQAHNPSTRELTFYSSRHISFSHIDFILISSSLFASVNGFSIRPIRSSCLFLPTSIFTV